SAETASAALRATFEGISADVWVGVTFGSSRASVNAIAHVSPGAADVDWYVKTRPFPVGEDRSLLMTAIGVDAPAGTLSSGNVVSRPVFRGSVGGERAPGALGSRAQGSGAQGSRHHGSVAAAICWEDMFAEAGHRA